jgi:hypothetical protein
MRIPTILLSSADRYRADPLAPEQVGRFAQSCSFKLVPLEGRSLVEPPEAINLRFGLSNIRQGSRRGCPPRFNP